MQMSTKNVKNNFFYLTNNGTPFATFNIYAK
jgi:hypothetical protein